MTATETIKKGDTMITESIEMPIYKKSYLKSKIDKINRKCAKIGCEPLKLTFGETFTLEYKEHPVTGAILLNPIVMEMVHATLEYEIPIIEGYELVAKLDIFPSLDGNREVLISAVPDKEVPDEYKKSD